MVEGAVLLARPTRRHSRSSEAVDDAPGKVPTRSAWLTTVVAAPRRRSPCSVGSANPSRFRSRRADFQLDVVNEMDCETRTLWNSDKSF